MIGENIDYRAFYYAIHYRDSVEAPETSSNWYLPSCGQWLVIEKDLGGFKNKPYTLTCYNVTGNVVDNRVRWFKNDDGSGLDYEAMCSNAINSYLNAVKSYADIFTIDRIAHGIILGGKLNVYASMFWSDTEVCVFAHSIIHKNDNCYVRPVIAF